MRLKFVFVCLSMLLAVNLWAGGVPVGSVMPFAGYLLPDETWLFCHGQTLANGDYPELNTALGGNFGQSLTTFNVPDLRFRFPLGNVSGSTRISETGGYENVTLTVDQIPSHTHSLVPNYFWVDVVSSVAYIFTSGNYPVSQLSLPITGSSGGDGSHSNMPPYIVLNYIIKAVADPVSDASLNDLNEALVWRFKSSLWIFGGICALTCSMCFFARS